MAGGELSGAFGTGRFQFLRLLPHFVSDVSLQFFNILRLQTRSEYVELISTLLKNPRAVDFRYA